MTPADRRLYRHLLLAAVGFMLFAILLVWVNS